MRLSAEARQVLQALAGGSFLKSHRYLDGSKVYRLHDLSGQSRPVSRATVDALVRHRLVTSNQKFPAATYMLTDRGRAIVQNYDGEHF